ncbi:MAG: PEP-CTERM sorting domain-containing protein [Fimbriimonadales bacterium]
MNYKAVAPLALLVLAGAAQAQLYSWDSGVSQNSVGLTAGGDIAWLEQFSVVGAFSQINSISTCFGTPLFPGSNGVTVGETFKVFVWSGTPTGTGVDVPTLLSSSNGTVAAGSIDTDVMQTVNISATITGTSNFFIGAVVAGTAGGFPAPLQQTDPGGFPIQPYSWVAGNTTPGGFDPNNLTGGIGLSTNSSVGFPGNWLIRANASAVPEPFTLTGMALALGSLALRRRKKA